MSSKSDKIYAEVKGHQDTCCDGRKKKSKKLSHRLLRHHDKNKLRKELNERSDI
jgi:hypothetical protein